MKEEFFEKFMKYSAECGVSNEALEKASYDVLGDRKAYILYFYQGMPEVIHSLEDYLNHKFCKIDIENTSGTTRKIREVLISRMLQQTLNHNFQKELHKYYHSFSTRILYVRISWKIADYMWNYIGDKSLDSNYYSKRIILSKIYNNVFNQYAKFVFPDQVQLEEVVDKELERIKIFAKLKQNFSINNIPFLRLLKK